MRRLQRARYVLTAYRALPVTFLRRVVFGRDPYWRQFFWSRWGYVPADVCRAARGRRVLLLDVLSGGEVTQLVTFCRSLRRALPDWLFVLSTFSRYSFDFAKANLGVDFVIDAPWDFPGPVRRALGRLEPAALVCVQNVVAFVLVREAKRRGVATVLVSGLMSRNIERDPMYAWTGEALAFQYFDAIGAWGEEDVRGFVKQGARPETVRVTGNMKYDLEYLRIGDLERAKLREMLQLDPDEPVFLAASLHPQEDVLVIDAYREARRAIPGLRLLLVPRYQFHVPQTLRALASRGMPFVLKSRLWTNEVPEGAVIVVDTFGDLARLYAIASVVFLGGSTYPRQVLGLGQNPIEPLAQGRPLLFGPFMSLWTDVTESLKQVWPGVEVRTAHELGAGVVEVLTSESLQTKLTEKMNEIVDAHRHDVVRNIHLVVDVVRAQYGSTSSLHQGS